MTFLLYGATGYTGSLIAEVAAARGLRPVLAGRDARKLAALGERLSLPWRAAALDDDAALVRALADVGAVLHCAGPFSRTSAAMVRACCATGVHYLDITGEIAVLEAVLQQHARAQKARVALLPGVGFDVVPSDCQAAHVKRLLPSATSLELFIRARGAASHGTMRTAVEGLHLEGASRRDGRIVPEPIGLHRRTFVVDGESTEGYSVPWGDVASAFFSTAIPNITVYFPPMKPLATWVRSATLRRAMKLAPVRALVARLLPSGGPSAEQRARGSALVLAIARDDASGQQRASLLRTPDGYALTADAALLSVTRVLAGEVAPGAHTPSQAFGPDFVLSCQGVSRDDGAPQ